MITPVTIDEFKEPNVWITLETDQKCVKPTVKINEKATESDIFVTVNRVITALTDIRRQLATAGLQVAPITPKGD